MNPNTTVLDGVRILELDLALAVKVNCLYLRSDDEKGANKRLSDSADILFLAEKCSNVASESRTRAPPCSESMVLLLFMMSIARVFAK